MNIHSIQNEGRGISLGPVTITKLFPIKPGDKSAYMGVSDPSGSANLKVWGAAAHSAFFEGASITLIGTGPKGNITNKEWPEGSGKWALNASDCRVEGLSGGSAAPVQESPQAAYQQRSAPIIGGDKLEAVMSQCAKATSCYVENLVVNHGFSKDEAIMLAQNAPSWFPLFWFGEKGIG